MVRFLSVILIIVGAVACSSGEHMAAAQEGIAAFRQLVEAQQFAKVHASGSEELRKSISEEDLAKILRGLNTKLGKARSVETNGWNVNYHTSGTFVTLGFKTEFEKGHGIEQFIFRIADGKALLVSYNVNSPVLLAN